MGQLWQRNMLVNYGIQNEHSNIRIHVCPKIEKVYVFATVETNKFISTKNYKMVKGFNTDGKYSAKGYLVPPMDIPNVRRYDISTILLNTVGFNDDDNEKAKGDKAQDVVYTMLEYNKLFEVFSRPEIIYDEILQRNGCDIIIDGVWIEIKCDYIGGEVLSGYPRTTGNLFLQTHERNYFK